MTIKYFLKVYPPKRMWRKFWIGLTCLPMLPQHRAKLLKLGGVDIKGRAMIYGGVGIDTVAPDHIHIGDNTAITSGVKILTHYLDPGQAGRHFRIGDVTIGKNVFIGVNAVICNSVSIGDGAIVGAGSCDQRYPSLSVLGWKSCSIYKGACSLKYKLNWK